MDIIRNLTLDSNNRVDFTTMVEMVNEIKDIELDNDYVYLINGTYYFPFGVNWV